MIRQLCFSAIAVLFATSSCFASFVIDDFSSEIALSSNATFTPVGYQAVLADGESATVTYSFAPTLSDSAAAVPGSGTSFTSLDFFTTTAPFADIDLEISGSSFTSVNTVLSAANTSVQIGPGLASTNSLTFTFTNNTGALNIFTFGGGALTAVPEPTSLLMFPAAIGLVLARRRRKS